MIETLKYIGRWFIRFILIAIIFSTFQSCAKALTYDEILDYVTRTAAYFPNNSKYQIIKEQISSVAMENQISQYASNYESAYIYWVKNSSYQPAEVWCVLFNDSDGILTGNGQLYYNGTYCNIPKAVTSSSTYNPQLGTGQTNMMACFRTSANQENNLTGMLYTNYTIEHMPATFVGNQAMPQYTYYIGNLHTKEITYSGETVLANTLSYNYRLVPIVNVVCEDTIITSMQATLDDLELRCNDLGSYWNLTYNNSTMFKYNQLYNLRVDSVIDGNILTLEAKILFVPPGTVIENNSIASIPSGNFSFNTENATNQIIDNQNKNQEDNQSFLDNLYNQMFTVSGEQVQQIVNTTIENINIPSGEIAEIEQIFNYLSGDARDFVISWTDKTTHFTVNGANISQMTIPARQINFSEMERQSPELQQAMHWARLITNVSIFSILIHEAYICLLATLGVPVAIYGQKLEEKQQLARQQQKQEQAWQNRLEQQRYNDWLYSHRKR